MSQPLITFTKVFCKDNIASLVQNNPDLIEKKSVNENFLLYDFTDKISIPEGTYKGYTFVSSELYIFDNFAFVNCSFEYNPQELEQLSKTAFRICHEKVAFPANDLIKVLFSSLGKDESLLFIRPSGNEIKKSSFNNFDDYFTQCKENKDSTEVYSFVFYNYEIENELSDKEILCLKNTTEGNSAEAKNETKIDSVEINSVLSLYATKIGCGILKSNSEKYISEDYNISLYCKFLETLKEIIYFEHKAKEFNSYLDNNNYENLDSLNVQVRRDSRKAVHLKYKIKNSLTKNSQEEKFFSCYLTALNFIEEMDEFFEICRSIEREIHAKIDQREEEHDKHFDKILSVVAVFAIVSVFKDGSDLILSMISALKTGVFDFSNLISILAPIFCAISIFIILHFFKKK